MTVAVGSGPLVAVQLVQRRKQQLETARQPHRIVDPVGLRDDPPCRRIAVLTPGQQRQRVAGAHAVHPACVQRARRRILPRGLPGDLLHRHLAHRPDRHPGGGEQGVLRLHLTDVAGEPGEPAPVEYHPWRRGPLLLPGLVGRHTAGEQPLHRGHHAGVLGVARVEEHLDGQLAGLRPLILGRPRALRPLGRGALPGRRLGQAQLLGVELEVDPPAWPARRQTATRRRGAQLQIGVLQLGPGPATCPARGGPAARRAERHG